MVKSGCYIGLDIGGTKIAAVATPDGAHAISEETIPTPREYDEFITACSGMISRLSSSFDQGKNIKVGIGVAARVDARSGFAHASANIPCIRGHNLHDDMAAACGKPVRIANDSGCMALAEAICGAGNGYSSVIGLIIGTGVGCGYVLDGHLVTGCNGLAGEIGHLPLPFREDTDGHAERCACGQTGCIESFISGNGLSRLHRNLTGEVADAASIAAMETSGNPAAMETMERYYELLAKALVAIAHTFDPDIIVMGGGVGSMPGLCCQAKSRWGKYVLGGEPQTGLATAQHGRQSGALGAALLWHG